MAALRRWPAVDTALFRIEDQPLGMYMFGDAVAVIVLEVSATLAPQCWTGCMMMLACGGDIAGGRPTGRG
jgi:hypothetical protein